MSLAFKKVVRKTRTWGYGCLKHYFHVTPYSPARVNICTYLYPSATYPYLRREAFSLYGFELNVIDVFNDVLGIDARTFLTRRRSLDIS